MKTISISIWVHLHVTWKPCSTWLLLLIRCHHGWHPRNHPTWFHRANRHSIKQESDESTSRRTDFKCPTYCVSFLWQQDSVREFIAKANEDERECNVLRRRALLHLQLSPEVLSMPFFAGPQLDTCTQALAPLQTGGRLISGNVKKTSWPDARPAQEDPQKPRQNIWI